MTNFVQDAAKVWNMRMVALFRESHEHVTAQGSKNLQCVNGVGCMQNYLRTKQNDSANYKQPFA